MGFARADDTDHLDVRYHGVRHRGENVVMPSTHVPF
jgi:hypothetical protein